eukprot:PhF_6_TR25671/c0_g1_i2/m.36165
MTVFISILLVSFITKGFGFQHVHTISSPLPNQSHFGQSVVTSHDSILVSAPGELSPEGFFNATIVRIDPIAFTVVGMMGPFGGSVGWSMAFSKDTGAVAIGAQTARMFEGGVYYVPKASTINANTSIGGLLDYGNDTRAPWQGSMGASVTTITLSNRTLVVTSTQCAFLIVFDVTGYSSKSPPATTKPDLVIPINATPSQFFFSCVQLTSCKDTVYVSGVNVPVVGVKF